jgi:hypothetical protein
MQLVQEIALVGQTLQPSVPKMVMGVADRELGFERRFLVNASQSFPPNGIGVPP